MTCPGSGGPQGRSQPRDPHVGIFWLVADGANEPALVVDKEPLLRAEPYGDCLTHPRGHYEVWTLWQRAGARNLKARGWPLTILNTPYEFHPRGRVVLFTPANTFWIYADRRLQTPETIAKIKTALGLIDETCLIKSDAHYS